MLRHIVLFRLKSSAHGRNAEENYRMIVNNVRKLKELPGVVTIAVGPHHRMDPAVEEPWASDLCVYVELASMEDYRNYVANPIHVKARDFAASVSESLDAITFEAEF